MTDLRELFAAFGRLARAVAPILVAVALALVLLGIAWMETK